MESQINCQECGRLVESVFANDGDSLVRSQQITDVIFHRYYNHKIIPLQEKYADLRNGQEEWYDEQVRKGQSDNYEWLIQ